ncbi:MAG: hypothetical protein ACJ72M_03025 [Propionibacteriaceae bacterium]|jgi:hypothetical protein
MGFKAATAAIRKIAYEADRDGSVQRGRTERRHRRVGIRPAPDTMAVLMQTLLDPSSAIPAAPNTSTNPTP